jgi:hypothetical protein
MVMFFCSVGSLCSDNYFLLYTEFSNLKQSHFSILAIISRVIEVLFRVIAMSMSSSVFPLVGTKFQAYLYPFISLSCLLLWLRMQALY